MIGYKVEDVTYDMLNLVCNIARCIVYRNHIKCTFKGQKYNANSLWVDFELMVKSYLESVSNYKFGLNGEV